MIERVRTSARAGLRLRKSPHDGDTVAILPSHTMLEVVGHETWFRVRDQNGREGFVLGDYLEPYAPTGPPAQIVRYDDQRNVFRSETPIRVNQDFVCRMEAIAEEAQFREITVVVTSSLRRPREGMVGSVVPPPNLSNHHVGHAIDVNLIESGTTFGSGELADFQALPTEIRELLEALKRRELRWGGWFDPADPVHIDDGLNIRQENVYREKWDALWRQS